MPKVRIAFGNTADEITFIDADYDCMEVPESELTNGIQRMIIDSSGDEVNTSDGVFVRVFAVDDATASKAYHRIWQTLTKDVLDGWYHNLDHKPLDVWNTLERMRERVTEQEQEIRHLRILLIETLDKWSRDDRQTGPLRMVHDDDRIRIRRDAKLV